jgi:hypothetical protein
VNPVLLHLTKSQKLRFEPIYRAQLYQFRSDAFHHFCDATQYLLVVCRTTNGKLFGGFSSESWDIKQLNGIFGRYRQSNTVLFSFTNRTVHRLKLKDQAIGCSTGLGPIFGTADIVIGDCNINNICMFPLAYKPDELKKTSDSLALTGGSTFTLE